LLNLSQSLIETVFDRVGVTAKLLNINIKLHRALASLVFLLLYGSQLILSRLLLSFQLNCSLLNLTNSLLKPRQGIRE
jgi:hypothetical protein